MVVVVFTVGEMKDMLTVVLSRGADLAVVVSWSGFISGVLNRVKIGGECWLRKDINFASFYDFDI
jgi:hypothetical protein